MKYVIIGNSAAAVGCVEALRQRDREGGITLISAEEHHTYSRPLISYLLGGKTDRERMCYRSADFYSDNNVKALLGRTVTAIRPEQQVIQLENGEVIPYDKLLVATGSSPVTPPIPGLESVPLWQHFMTLDDARALEQTVDNNSRVLILGAGLIGLKCAEGLHKRAGHITVLDLAEQILPSVLDVEAAGRMEEHIRAQGVELILGDSAASFDRNTVTLASGRELVFDVLVMAVGVRPNTELVARAGGEIARGIVTDEYCRTSLPGIYAAGDCTESVDLTTGEHKVMALLPGAYMQGETVGLHMTGEEKPYDKAIPMNAVGFFGLHVITAGSCREEGYTSSEGGNYKRLSCRDNRLVGFILLGDVARAGIYTSLIRERTPLDSVDFELIRERPQLMAFSRKERREKLAMC